jgi:hypothetical protein
MLKAQPWLQATLFFGRSVPQRQPVSRQEWDAFANSVITARFPDGFTVLDARGQWRNQVTSDTISEDTTILLVAAENSPATLGKLDEIVRDYERRFKQHSVGLLIAPACARF